MKKISIAIMAIIMVFSCLLCLVGCDNAKDAVEEVLPEKIGVVDINSICYDNTKLTWNAVDGAKEYLVKFNDETNEKVVTSTQITQLMTSDFTVSIKAKGNKKVGEAVTKTFHKLANVEGLEISETGELSWGLVEGADAYKILLNNKELPEAVFETTFNNYVEGKNTVKIKPINSQDPSYFGSWSEMKTITITPNPTNVKYDGQYISWQGNSLAETYEVYINGVIYETVKGETRLLYDAKQTSFNLKIRSTGNHVTTFDAKIPEEDIQILFLKPVSEFFVENGSVSWPAVEDAKGYQLEINGVVQEQPILDPIYKNIPEGKRLSIRVKPISSVENTFTDWSVAKEVFMLPKPVAQWNQALALDGDKANSLFWDAVSGASGYTVEITYPNKLKEEKVLSKDDKSFAYDYLEVGEYKLRIKANAEANTSTYESAYSKAVTVVRLAAPKASAENFLSSDKKDLASGVTVSFEAVSGAKEYRLYKDAVEMQGNNSTTPIMQITDIIPESVTTQQDVNFSIQSVGSFVNNSHGITATLDSLSASNLTFKVTVLAMPKNMDMQGYKYTWEGSSSSDEYGVNVGGNIRIVNTTSVDLSYIEAGNHNVSICSAGNGADILPSYYTAPLAVKRLAAPSNISIITTDAEEGRLDWNKIEYAKSYTVLLGKNSEPVDVNKLSNLNSKISENGTSVSMRAIANYYNSEVLEERTEYYMTSEDSETVQFIKLATVEITAPYIRNGNLVWNSPKNLDSKVYTPTYRIYDQSGKVYNGQANSTSLSLATIKPGTYTFSVKAIGDGANFINSGVSNTVKVTKLETPVVEAKDSVYQWAGVPGATAYKAYVDGVPQSDIIHDSANQTYSFAPHFTDIKKYTVEVVAVGDNINIVDSNPCEILQQTKQLAAPEFAFKYSKEAFDKAGNIEVNITKKDANASGYIYNVGYDTEVVESEMIGESYTYCPKSAGSYKIGVKAIGRTFGIVDGVNYYFIDSAFAGNNETNTLYILDAPSGVEINQDNQVIFNPVTKASSYDIMIIWDGDEAGAEIVNTTSLSYNLKAGTHSSVQVKVRAVGIGGKRVTSEWQQSEIITLK